MKPNFMFIALLLVIFNTAGKLWAQLSGSVTQGIGTITVTDLMPDCPSNHTTPLGTITSTDGQYWVVPAENNFQTASKISDLYNSCNGITPANLAAADLATVPIVEIDPGGEVVTGFLFADNYFELFINDVLIGVDAVPFTPFNSSVVKFRVSKPYTIAVKLVDWEENPGLGSEINNGNNFHPGDGGFIAQFSDGTVTDASWKVQAFYIAPIQNLNNIQELPDGTHSTTNATTTPTCNSNCYGVHYSIPGNWAAENFDEMGWQQATLYTAAQVTNQAAYTNFAATAWPNATFIWSSNLILDNVVLARKTVGSSSAGDLTSSNLNFSIAPNPSTGYFSLKITALEIAKIQSVLIVDTRGVLVFQAKTVEPILDIKGLTQGVYFLKIKFDTGEVSRKIIIQ